MFQNAWGNAANWFSSPWHYVSLIMVLLGCLSMLLSKTIDRKINRKKEGSFELIFKCCGWFAVALGAVLAIL